MLVMLIGFAAMTGLLAGYLTARLLPPFAIWVLWAGCAALVAIAFIWSQNTEASGGFDTIVILYGIVVPFAGCAGVAGLLGLVARAALKREQTE